jgi:putative addiction module component (TIGR02574 family)
MGRRVAVALRERLVRDRLRRSRVLNPAEGSGGEGFHDRLSIVGAQRWCAEAVTRPVLHWFAMSTDELLVEALRLSRRDRARVAEELLSSLEEPDEEIAAAWAAELERRSRDIGEGHAQTIDWETARAELLNELEQRRARRTTP